MFKINEQLLVALLNYLTTRPYREVAQMVDALQKLEKLEQVDTK